MKATNTNLDIAEIKTDAAFETREATILATPQMFDMLSTKLYPVPLTAAIREVMKNALDAHIEYNVDRPFEISVPTSLDPNFVCRDFGPVCAHDWETLDDYPIFDGGKSTKRVVSSIKIYRCKICSEVQELTTPARELPTLRILNRGKVPSPQEQDNEDRS